MLKTLRSLSVRVEVFILLLRASNRTAMNIGLQKDQIIAARRKKEVVTHFHARWFEESTCL